MASSLADGPLLLLTTTTTTTTLLLPPFSSSIRKNTRAIAAPYTCSPSPSTPLHLTNFRCRVVRCRALEPLPSSLEIALTGKSAATVVRDFYAAINRRDLDHVKELIGENCVYEDLIFPHRFAGRKAILEFFSKFTSAVGPDLLFVIDDLSNGDFFAVGVTWHLEWRGKPFPFSRGCSFYRCEISNGKQFITYGRDSVEPAAKPGDIALVGANCSFAYVEIHSVHLAYHLLCFLLK